jgi:hypothetical protein
VHLGTADCASAIMNALGQYKQDWGRTPTKKESQADTSATVAGSRCRVSLP